jgi:hypothetical protein
MAKETKAQLQYFNAMLDKECQKLMQEKDLLLGLISLMMSSDDVATKMFKISGPDRVHIKIDNDWCTITRECNGVDIDQLEEVSDNATMQKEN